MRKKPVVAELIVGKASDLNDASTRNVSYAQFLATHGGTRCPQCGRFAKQEELGNLSHNVQSGAGWAHVTMFGHLAGFGCNK